MLNIRLAKDEDIEVILEAARDIHSKASFATVPFDEDTVSAVIFSFIDGPVDERMLVLAENEKNEVVGVLAATVIPSFYSLSRIAAEPLFWSNGSPKVFKALTECFEDWAKSVKADFVIIGSHSQYTPERWSKFYKKFGYKPYENTFMKELKE